MISNEFSHGRPFQFFPVLDFITSSLIQPMSKAAISRSPPGTIRNTQNTRKKRKTCHPTPNNGGVTSKTRATLQENQK